ncbi:MAG TPA: hypothetical protein VG148_14515 [Pyrinomonadaceae bacterium]|nr:hypothetical protein [Pyrinomonadaceae bacterium]
MEAEPHLQRQPSKPSARREARRRRLTVFGVAACFYLLTCAGRMASSDSYTQLQASVLLVSTGRVAAEDTRPHQYAWVVGPGGGSYQAHDPGNIILFIPAAVVAVLAGGDDAFRDVPLAARVAAALTYALVGAACVAALYRALAIVLSERAALAAAALAACATPLWVYTRSTLDVLPAALGTALTMWAVLAHAAGRVTAVRAAALAALAAALAGWFRVSVLPFVAAPAAVTLITHARGARLRAAAVFASVLAACMAPVLAYNYVRTGNPFVLATMLPQYAHQNGFAGEFATGLYGLFVSPNRGLFVFAPWLALALVPFGLRRLPARLRFAAVAFLFGAAAYALVIAGLRQWTKPEWGPRYLVPVIPVFALHAAVAAVWLWRTRRRPAVVAPAVLSLAFTLPAGVVNYSYVVTSFPGAHAPLAGSPRQIIGSYDALWRGLTGREPLGPAEVREDPERAPGLRFPDLWLARLYERGGIFRAAALILTLTLLTGLVWGVRRLALRTPASHGEAVL